MNLKTELGDAGIRQSTMDDFESRHLLSDEQDRLAARESVRDQIRDCLRLASPGWTFKNEVVPARDRDHRAQLARVGIDNLEGLLGRVLDVQFHCPYLIRKSYEATSRLRYNLPNESMTDE